MADPWGARPRAKPEARDNDDPEPRLADRVQHNQHEQTAPQSTAPHSNGHSIPIDRLMPPENYFDTTQAFLVPDAGVGDHFPN